MLILVTGLPGTGKTSLAQMIAADLSAAVIGHDWVMTGLRSHPSVWGAMEHLDHREFRSVGWSIMWNIALAQLREGRFIILDGVARSPEIAQGQRVAREADARLSQSSAPGRPGSPSIKDLGTHTGYSELA